MAKKTQKPQLSEKELEALELKEAEAEAKRSAEAVILAGPGMREATIDRTPEDLVEEMLSKGRTSQQILAVAGQIRKGHWREKVKQILVLRGIPLPPVKEVVFREIKPEVVIDVKAIEATGESHVYPSYRLSLV